MKAPIEVGIIGLGNIGQAVARQLVDSREAKIVWVLDLFALQEEEKRTLIGQLAQRQGCSIEILAGGRPELLEERHLTDCVVEVTGDADAVHFLSRIRALKQTSGKKTRFVTANKATIAKHPSHFFDNDHSGDVGIEASVAAGLPLIRSLSEHISSDAVLEIAGIVNGTTNFILGQIAAGGSYDRALAEAIAHGYAEPGGKGDVDGMDAANKLLILTRIALGVEIPAETFLKGALVRGIDIDGYWDSVRYVDFCYAQKYLDATIKLLAVVRAVGEGEFPKMMVHPVLVPRDWQLSRVAGPDNHVRIISEKLKYTTMQGKGAGGDPTACAILADVFSAATRPRHYHRPHKPEMVGEAARAIGFDRWMVRAVCFDQPGVLHHITDVFLNLPEGSQIGLDEVYQIQKGDPRFAECVASLGMDGAPDGQKAGKSLVPFAFTVTATNLFSLRQALQAITEQNLAAPAGAELFPKIKNLFALYPLLSGRDEECLLRPCGRNAH